MKPFILLLVLTFGLLSAHAQSISYDDFKAIIPALNNEDFKDAFGTRDGVLIASITATNRKGTSILCFEYFKFHDTVNPADFIGKDVRTGGILRSVDTNPNKSTIWISRLHVEDVFIHTL